MDLISLRQTWLRFSGRPSTASSGCAWPLDDVDEADEAEARRSLVLRCLPPPSPCRAAASFWARSLRALRSLAWRSAALATLDRLRGFLLLLVALLLEGADGTSSDM